MNNGTHRLLIINAGSTSTKVALYDGDVSVWSEVITHSRERISRILDVWDQYEMRRAEIMDLLRQKGTKLTELTAIVSRGGTFRPVESGTYAINDEMMVDAKSQKYGTHVCGVGCKIALDLSRELSIPALTVDPPATDEMISEARYTGLPELIRKSLFQALNQKATGKKLAAALGKSYKEINAVIVHMGGGMSIAAHRRGRVIDVNNGLDGDGPFAPERAGTLPAGDLIRIAYSGKFTLPELLKRINGGGGLLAHLGTTDAKEVEARIKAGDAKAKEVYDAMAYQIAKSMGAAAVSLQGEVDALAFTGGLAYSKYLVDKIAEWAGWIAPVYMFPGEDELGSLARGALAALNGEEAIRTY